MVGMRVRLSVPTPGTAFLLSGRGRALLDVIFLFVLSFYRVV
jgi:hypothetical protein